MVPLPGGRPAVRGARRGPRKSGGSSQVVRLRRGEAKVWFYRNPSSIDVYVRPGKDGKQSPAPICFRISSRDFVGR